MLSHRPGLVVLPLALLLLAGCGTPTAREPRNLGDLKLEIDRYVESGDYQRGIAEVARRAKAWIVERSAHKKPGERPAIILDVDETMLSNLPLIRQQDYGYIANAWTEWVGEGQCPAIVPVRDAYRAAVEHGVSVLIITGRREQDRPGTEANLKAAGFGSYAGLYFKPDDSPESTAEYKRAWRRKLAAEGYTLIANLGDQASDFDGGGAERDFKLPDPFYLTK